MPTKILVVYPNDANVTQLLKPSERWQFVSCFLPYEDWGHLLVAPFVVLVPFFFSERLKPEALGENTHRPV